MTEARNYPLPGNYDRDIDETSFSNLGFDDNRQYNTSDNNNLTDAYGELGPPPSLLGHDSLAKRFNEYVFTTDRVDALGKSLSKTPEWKYTKTGLNEISSKIYLVGSKYFMYHQNRR